MSWHNSAAKVQLAATQNGANGLLSIRAVAAVHWKQQQLLSQSLNTQH